MTATGKFRTRSAAGAYLRLDIPVLETEDEFILYTDCDVMFAGSAMEWGDPPEFFSCAPEVDPGNWSYANTGVMVMNVPNMRREHDGLLQYARDNMATSIAYDQGAFNSYFAGRWSRLPIEMNWKPYWGISDDARIVHFHGPKPHQIERYLAGGRGALPPLVVTLIERNLTGASHYLHQFQEMEPRQQLP